MYVAWFGICVPLKWCLARINPIVGIRLNVEYMLVIIIIIIIIIIIVVIIIIIVIIVIVIIIIIIIIIIVHQTEPRFLGWILVCILYESERYTKPR